MANILQWLGRLVHHRWADSAIPTGLRPDAIARLTQRVAASEQRHTGQIRICVEGGLPLGYLWRSIPPRERALTLFGKLRVWDTEHNNGVLIYLLVADHAIEIVADRGLARHVPPDTWSTLVRGLGDALRAGRYEDGLDQALTQVTALLEQHFAPVPDALHSARPNELPDAPVLPGDPLLD